MIDVTIVCPIRNEAKLLPRTIESHYALDVAAVYFTLDACTDDSLSVIVAASARHPHTDTIIDYTHEGEGAGYSERAAYLRRRAYDRCTTEYILNSAADLQLDPAIKKHLIDLDRYPLISFGFYEANIQGLARLGYHALKRTHYGGITAFSKETYEACEDLEDLKTGRLREDRHLIEAISARHPTKHIPTLTRHLRPRPHNWGRFVKWDTETI